MERYGEQQLPAGVVKQVSSRTGREYLFNTYTGESWYPSDVLSVSQPPAQNGFSDLGGPPPAKRARVESSKDEDNAASSSPAAAVPQGLQVSLAVAAAYDAHADRGIHGRKESSILHLKNFNNWVKAVLIAEYAPKSQRVLDLACGKCGDIQKWRIAGVEKYCGVDISMTGVTDGASRFNSVNSKIADPSKRMQGKLVRADLGITNLKASGVVGANEQFDTISIQFALHYLFQSEHRALAFFRNIADCLAIGGVFLGTIPDAAYLVRRIRDVATAGKAAAAAAASSSGAVDSKEGIKQETRFGNSIYYIDFDGETVERQWNIRNNPWGLGYTFYLAESVEHVKEYLVPWPLLERLAASCGLVPLASDNFHSFYRRMTGTDSTPIMVTTTAASSSSAGAGPIPPRVAETVMLPPSPNAGQHINTLRTMQVMDCEGTMSKEEWEAAGIYRVFAFKRVRTEGEAVSQSGATQLPSASLLFPKGIKRVDGAVQPVTSFPDGSTRGGEGLDYAPSIEPEDIADLLDAAT